MAPNRSVARPVSFAATLLLMAGGVFVFSQTGCRDGHRAEFRTTVQQVRDLSQDQVRAGTPVRIRGTITYMDPWQDLIFVQDATGGVAVDAASDRSVHSAGEVVEVTGVAAESGVAPLIVESHFHTIGRRGLPPAAPIPFGGADLDRFEYLRASISGLVHSAYIEPQGQVLALVINSEGRKVVAKVLEYPAADFLSLVGAEVTVRGVATSTLDVWLRPVDLQIRVPNMDDVVVNQHATPAQDLQVQTIREVQAMVPGVLPKDRLRIRGKCLDNEIGSSHLLDDGTGQIRVVLAPYAPSLSAGEVDLAGFLRYEGQSAVLDAATPIAAPEPNEAPSPAKRAVLTEVRQFHHMSGLDARKQYPIRILATVTYYDPVTRNLFVQDRTEGTYVFANGLQGMPRYKPGDQVEVTGVTFPGDFAPTIGNPSIRVAGHGPLPEPRSSNSDDIFVGAEDSQWVEMEGTIHGLDSVIGHALITLRWQNRTFRAHIIGLPVLPESYRGALVRMRGVAGSLFNRRRQLLGIQLFVPGIEYVKVLEPAPGDPFALPVREVDALLQYSPGVRPDGLTHVRGLVTLSDPYGPTWIRSNGGALTVRNHKFAALSPGDLVDVVGFPAQGPFSSEMQDAVIRKTANGPPPEPLQITADEAREGNYDARLVQIDAILADQTGDLNGRVFRLQSGRTSFSARIPERPGMPVLTPGAVLRLTGICSVEVDNTHEIVVPRAFTLRLRSPADIAILQDAPWWTPDRMLNALALTTGTILLTFTWVVVLRRRVKRQTRVIEAKLEEEARLRDEAQAANRAKGEFLANVTHELRTPMNGIVGFTALALETELNGEQRDYMETVRNSADSLLRMINDILDFSRTGAGSLQLDEADFSLAECLGSAMKIVETHASGKGLETRCEIAPEVPARLRGDAERLRQIVLNLLNNAIKFTARGSVVLRTVLESEDDSGVSLRMSVTDTGIGIPQDKQAAVFEPFRQADGSITRKYGGTGLGLAISRNLTRLLGGEMRLESEPGKGSIFTFTVRFRRAREANETVTQGDAPAALPTRPLSILVAEDNAVNRRLLITMLESRGHRVRAVTNGLEAVEAIGAGDFDLVLMDLQMPEMDGIEATAAIRRKQNGDGRVPVYAFTAHNMAGDAEKAVEAGMDGYLAKPVRSEDLLALVNRVAAAHPDEVRSTQANSFRLQNAVESEGFGR